jgi:hypothetical protein
LQEVEVLEHVEAEALVAFFLLLHILFLLVVYL